MLESKFRSGRMEIKYCKACDMMINTNPNMCVYIDINLKLRYICKMFGFSTLPIQQNDSIKWGS